MQIDSASCSVQLAGRKRILWLPGTRDRMRDVRAASCSFKHNVDVSELLTACVGVSV